MPFYEYEHDGAPPDGCENRFETLQAISEPPLRACPTCGEPVHRVISTFSVGSTPRSLLSADNIAKHGFTQYKKVGKGQYEKTAGRGPEGIQG